MIRDKDSGKSKGFCFLCYEDQRSTVLAVDNFNGIKILNRTIRVDHVSNYKVPKEGKKTDAETKKLYQEGCAPKSVPPKPPTPPPQPIKPSVIPQTPVEDLRYTLADTIVDGVRLPPRLPIDIVKKEKLSDDEKEKVDSVKVTKEKKKKKDKKHKKKSKKKRKNDSSSDSESESSSESSEEERINKRRKHEDRERGKNEDGRSRDEKRHRK